MEKAAIGDIVANVDFVENLTKDKGLKDKYIHFVALAQDKALKAEEFTFCQRFLMMQILYR